MKESVTDSAASIRAERDVLAARLAELKSLSLEVAGLFDAQMLAAEDVNTEAEVCEAFSRILLRHWALCSVAIYLRDESGALCERALHVASHLDAEKTRSACALLVSEVARSGREQQIWLDEQHADTDAELRCAFESANLQAGIGAPIYARGVLAGALVALTTYPDQLRAALDGIRFIAAPIVVAIGSAHRAEALRAQRQRIEHLVDELQTRTRELEEANSELRRVALYRSLFLARMSHELRTPLTSILGFAEILLDHENMTATQRRFCEKIQTSGLQLQMSLKQLVDLSRLEAGQMEIFLHEFSLREALRESCAAVGRLAQKHGVRISCCSEPDLPSIVSDESKLRQVLYNFLAYAISRSPMDGVVTVRAARAAPEAPFCVSIADEGEPLADFSRIFEPVDATAPSEAGASLNELGLAIARRLLDVLGGEVTLENRAPRGLNVTISLPARPGR
jgi:signal transduction histidine kinase